MMSTAASTPSEFQALLYAIENSPIAVPALAVEALEQVRDGIITGEGPTTAGRAHFSRSLDGQDTAYCSRILLAAGGEAGTPVTRAEADMLLAIDAAAAERHDEGGVFDDLFVKAVTHHVLAATGRPVPPRAIALSPETALESWAETPRGHDVDHEVLEWIISHVRGARRISRSLMVLAVFLIGAAAPFAKTLATAVDLTS